MRCQVLSLLEVLPDLDADGSGTVDSEEVAQSQAAIFGYVAEHYRLIVGADEEGEGGSALVPTLDYARFSEARQTETMGFQAGAVDISMRYRAPEPIDALVIEMTLFLDTSPDHVDLASVAWDTGKTDSFGLERRLTRVRSTPAGRSVFGTYVRLGVQHISTGWDHLAFVVALLLASRSVRGLLWVVTAFTAAHSVTLAMASLGLVNVEAYTGLIEAAVALSIAYVAADNLLHQDRKRTRWVEAFVFGLLHGLGFASFLGQSLLHAESKVVALFGFNVGVEIGQVAVVLVLAFVLSRLPRGKGEVARGFAVPRVVRIAGSLLVTAMGLYWFFERI